tara:strand:- start:1206 stop:1397 length:192 start_codon:yes stop_codon:yes gene_type:complete
MEYDSLFEPLLCIFLSMSLGLLMGTIFTVYATIKETKELKRELEKFRKLYHELEMVSKRDADE